jgi:hypothetical protein
VARIKSQRYIKSKRKRAAVPRGVRDAQAAKIPRARRPPSKTTEALTRELVFKSEPHPNKKVIRDPPGMLVGCGQDDTSGRLKESARLGSALRCARVRKAGGERGEEKPHPKLTHQTHSFPEWLNRWDYFSVRSSCLRITPKSPADTDRGIKAVGAVGAQVSGTEVLAIAAEILELMLADAKLETFWHLERKTDGTVKTHGFHGSEVTHLRDVSAKRKLRLEEQHKMTSESPAHGLNFEVSTKEVASIGGTARVYAAGIGRLGKHAAAQVRLIVGRRDIKISVTANPIVGEEQAGLHGGRVFSGHEVSFLSAARKDDKEK